MSTTTGNSQTTSLSPNSNCLAVGSGDANMTTLVKFMAPPNGIAWYTTSVSTGNPTTTLATSVGNGVVTFLAGLAVTLTQLGDGAYNVTVSGQIKDNNSLYNYAGQVIYMSTAAPVTPPVVEQVSV